MRSLSPWAMALCALMTSAGCYTGSPYVRRHATLDVDGGRLLAAAEASARAQGLRVLRVQPEPGLVVAVTPTDRVGDLSMRERWHIVVRGGDVTVEMHPEMKVEGEPGAAWERDTRVCGCYHYARERELLRAIRARVEGRRAPR